MEHLSNPLVLLAIAILGPVLRDIIVAILKDKSKALLGDKDPSNDSAAAALKAAAEAIEHLKLTLPVPKKK